MSKNKFEIEYKNIQKIDYPAGPYDPITQPLWDLPVNQCPKCGMIITGIMGYVCSTPNCPTGFGSPFCEDSSKTIC